MAARDDDIDFNPYEPYLKNLPGDLRPSESGRLWPLIHQYLQHPVDHPDRNPSRPLRKLDAMQLRGFELQSLPQGQMGAFGGAAAIRMRAAQVPPPSAVAGTKRERPASAGAEEGGKKEKVSLSERVQALASQIYDKRPPHVEAANWLTPDPRSYAARQLTMAMQGHEVLAKLRSWRDAHSANAELVSLFDELLAALHKHEEKRRRASGEGGADESAAKRPRPA